MSGRITVVGLGPAGSDLITAAVFEAIACHRQRFVRTARHPAAVAVSDAHSFVACDDVYETAGSFAEVYETITARLISAAAAGDLLYAVPGSPLVLERSVELLRERCPGAGIPLTVVPAMSFLDLAWQRLGIDPVTAGVRLIDGQNFASAAAGQTGPLLVAQCHSRRVLSEIKLALSTKPDPADGPVLVLQRLGLGDESIREVSWHELDRVIEPDHLTSLFVAELADPVAAELVRFDELVRVLRERCPWDREQTHVSLRRHLLEETYETLEALDARDELDDSEPDDKIDAHLAEELGDLLYQVFFHALLATERGSFTVADVARGIHDKLVSRHPHVFGDVEAADVAAVGANWEAIKRQEKERDSALDGIPRNLPALARALKVRQRASSVGPGLGSGSAVQIDPVSGSRSDVDSAIVEVDARLAALRAAPGRSEMADSALVGELLFAVVELSRQLLLDPETALRDAINRFDKGFRCVEKNTSQP